MQNLQSVSERGLKEIIAVMASASIVGFATGFSIPYVTLKLVSQNVEAEMIGLMAAMPALGILMIAPFVGMLARKYSIKPILLTATLLSGISILLLGLTENITAWIFFRLLMGLSNGILIVLGESWVNHIAKDKTRGRLVATYTTVFTICQLSGPSLLAVYGSQSWTPLTIAVLLHLITIGFLAFSQCDFSAGDKKSPIGLFSFARAAPVIIFAVLLFSFFDSVMLSLLPLYGIEHHFTENYAVLMVTIVFVGDACLQLPIGWCIDHFNSKRIHQLCGVILLVLLGALPFIINIPGLLWPALIILGGAAGGIYTIGLILIGEHFKGAALITGNACINLAWGVGSLTGPVISSLAMDNAGPNGMIVMLMGMTALFLASSARRIKSHV